MLKSEFSKHKYPDISRHILTHILGAEIFKKVASCLSLAYPFLFWGQKFSQLYYPLVYPAYSDLFLQNIQTCGEV